MEMIENYLQSKQKRLSQRYNTGAARKNKLKSPETHENPSTVKTKCATEDTIF
jgi:hypothetical protein